MNLSKDASEILDILLLTNAHYPEINISKDQFLEVKSNWLIKNSNLQLIEDYLLKNQMINEHPNLTKLLVDEYLARSDVKKSCEIFSISRTKTINTSLCISANPPNMIVGAQPFSVFSKKTPVFKMVTKRE
jgi:hypothetical protein